MYESIKEKYQQIKLKHGNRLEVFITAFIILFSATFGFGLGRLTKIEDSRVPVRIEQIFPQNIKENLGASVSGATGGILPNNSEGVVVGSKNSDKYHYPWCSGAKRIAPHNKVTFKSVKEAKAQGYKPAGNCPGIK
jgi:hypothetical protein